MLTSKLAMYGVVVLEVGCATQMILIYGVVVVF